MPFIKKYYSTKPDFEQRDWLLFSMQQLIENVDANISVNIITAGESKLLIASNISEDSITKLSFLSNSDFNNNYLYLENFSVFLNSYNEPLNIPGLNDIIINQYRRSDIINGFTQGKKTFQPFSSCNLGNINFNDMVDNITSIIPGCTSTKNKNKFYEIVLNPDLPDEPSVPSTTTAPSIPTAPVIETPSQSTLIDIALNNPELGLVPGVQDQRERVNNDIQTVIDFVELVNNVVSDAQAVINPAIKEATALPGQIKDTLSDPNNIFFLREPKNFLVDTGKSIGRGTNVISSSVNRIVKTTSPSIFPKIKIKLPPPPPKIKFPKFRF